MTSGNLLAQEGGIVLMVGYAELVTALVFLVLVLFGIGYNALTEWMERNGRGEGYTAFLVVGGVLATTGGVAILDPNAALKMLICFAGSGTPMLVGSVMRYVRAREQHQRGVIDDATKAAAR